LLKFGSTIYCELKYGSVGNIYGNSIVVEINWVNIFYAEHILMAASSSTSNSDSSDTKFEKPDDPLYRTMNRFIRAYDRYIICNIFPTIPDLDNDVRFNNLTNEPKETTYEIVDLTRGIALGWQKIEENSYVNGLNGMISSHFPRASLVGAPVPNSGYPESVDLERSFEILDRTMRRWLSAYDSIYTEMGDQINTSASDDGWANEDSYMWGMCQIIRLMAPIALITFDFAEITKEKRWDALVDNCKILVDESNNVKIYSKNHKGDEIFELNPSYNAPGAPISVVRRIWNELCLNHKKEHIDLVESLLRIRVCSHLIKPTGMLDFTSVGKKLQYNSQFFATMNLGDTHSIGRSAIILIPAVISSEWPYFFVAKGIME
jgi:hypothetical protein